MKVGHSNEVGGLGGGIWARGEFKEKGALGANMFGSLSEL